jgi:hypothetical protein
VKKKPRAPARKVSRLEALERRIVGVAADVLTIQTRLANDMLRSPSNPEGTTPSYDAPKRQFPARTAYTAVWTGPIDPTSGKGIPDAEYSADPAKHAEDEAFNQRHRAERAEAEHAALREQIAEMVRTNAELGRLLAEAEDNRLTRASEYREWRRVIREADDRTRTELRAKLREANEANEANVTNTTNWVAKYNANLSDLNRMTGEAESSRRVIRRVVAWVDAHSSTAPMAKHRFTCGASPDDFRKLAEIVGWTDEEHPEHPEVKS